MRHTQILLASLLALFTSTFATFPTFTPPKVTYRKVGPDPYRPYRYGRSPTTIAPPRFNRSISDNSGWVPIFKPAESYVHQKTATYPAPRYQTHYVIYYPSVDPKQPSLYTPAAHSVDPKANSLYTSAYSVEHKPSLYTPAYSVEHKPSLYTPALTVDHSPALSVVTPAGKPVTTYGQDYKYGQEYKYDSESLKPYKYDPEALKGYQYDSEALKGYKVDAEALKGYKIDAEALKGYKVDAEALKGYKVDTEALKSYAEALKGYKVDGEALKGYAEALKGYKFDAEALKSYTAQVEALKSYASAQAEAAKGYTSNTISSDTSAESHGTSDPDHKLYPDTKLYYYPQSVQPQVSTEDKGASYAQYAPQTEPVYYYTVAKPLSRPSTPIEEPAQEPAKQATPVPVFKKAVVQHYPVISAPQEEKKAKKAVTVLHSGESHGHSEGEDEHSGDEKYEFGYRVHDSHTGSEFGQMEQRHGSNSRGHYHVMLPDGRLQVVRYYTDHEGFHADVSYEGKAHHIG
nr:PREDICTED: uncharacterized protein LOC109034502 [Bemisia tabaci]